MSLLFVGSLAIIVPGLFGKDFSVKRGSGDGTQDPERRPLLDDE